MTFQQYAMLTLALSAIAQREDAFEGLDREQIETLTHLLEQAHQAAVAAGKRLSTTPEEKPT